MTVPIKPFTSGDPVLRRAINQIIKQVNALMNVTGDGLIVVDRSEHGMALKLRTDIIQSRMPKTGGAGEVDVAKLFQIESSAIGPGIYNCLPTVIDSEEWNVENEWDIIEVKQEGEPPQDVTETELVLNLDELTNITDTWSRGTSYSDGDWTHHAQDDTDYRAIKDHCAGGCVDWFAKTWTIGDRCRYNGHAYQLFNNDKTSGDTDPPTSDVDWVLDDDEPNVGNNWENYWDQGPGPKLSAGDMMIAFKVTDSDGNTRLVGRVFGQNALEQFFEECS